MASRSVERVEGSRSASLLFTCIADHGSAAHPYFGSEALQSTPDAARNVADAVHFLCSLHGRHPGVVDLAALRTIDPAARAWLANAADAMAVERAFLTRLAVAAGPAPSTPGGATSEAAVVSQRTALSTLAQSDRTGCALGAALAFAADWTPVRALLGIAARRLGVDAPVCSLGDDTELRLVADVVGESPAVERALLFGAQQLAHQHFGLWDLLEARYLARRDS